MSNRPLASTNGRHSSDDQNSGDELNTTIVSMSNPTAITPALEGDLNSATFFFGQPPPQDPTQNCDLPIGGHDRPAVSNEEPGQQEPTSVMSATTGMSSESRLSTAHRDSPSTIDASRSAVPPPLAQDSQPTAELQHNGSSTSTSTQDTAAELLARVAVLERENRQYRSTLTRFRIRCDSLERISGRSPSTSDFIGFGSPTSSGMRSRAPTSSDLNRGPALQQQQPSTTDHYITTTSTTTQPSASVQPPVSAHPPASTHPPIPEHPSVSAQLSVSEQPPVTCAQQSAYGQTAPSATTTYTQPLQYVAVNTTASNVPQFVATGMPPSTYAAPMFATTGQQASTVYSHPQMLVLPGGHVVPAQQPYALTSQPQAVLAAPVPQTTHAGVEYVSYGQPPLFQSAPAIHLASAPRPPPFAIQQQMPAPGQPVAGYYVNTYNTSSTSDDGRSQDSVGATARDGQAWTSRPAEHRVQEMQNAPGTIPAAAPPCHRFTPLKYLHDLPPFSGRSEEWPKFINTFEATTQEFGYTNLDNMTRLEKALVGTAKARVQHILLCPEEVPHTIETLAKAFGRPELLAESQMAEIRKFPKIGENRVDLLSEFALVVEGVVAFLNKPATADLLYTRQLLQEILDKLPTSERRIWSGFARRLGRRPSVVDFSLWMSETAEDIADMRPSALGESQQTRARDGKPAVRGRHVLLNVTNTPSPNRQRSPPPTRRGQPHQSPSRPSNSRNQSGRTQHSTTRCSFCGEGHRIDDCVTFINLSPSQRLSQVMSRPLCLLCLADNHLLPACRRSSSCGVDGCEYRHHVLIHEHNKTPRASCTGGSDRSGTQDQPASQLLANSKPKSSRAVREPQAERTASQTANGKAQRSAEDGKESTAALNCHIGSQKQSLYYRIVPVILHGPKKKLQTYALLDEGSSVSLVDGRLANELGLEGESRPLDLRFVSGGGAMQQSRKVSMGISGVGGNGERSQIDKVQTVDSLSLPVQTVDRDEIVRKNPHLSDVPFSTFTEVQPKILLGLEHHYLGVPLETRTSIYERSIVAARTKLGWVLYGSCGSLPGAMVCHVRKRDDEDDEDASDRLELLNELVRQHFTTEDFGVKAASGAIESDSNKRARRILEDTTRRVGGKFETGLLWKKDDIILPNSYRMALQRLASVEAKMRRDPVYSLQYRDQIQAYLQKGYARKMEPKEVERRGDRTWYLPHFAVKHASKPGKFRMVFDAAATSQGTSLNCALMSGPDLNMPLARLLMRFRLGEVGVCADVKEMFHQVLVRLEDQDAQRFLWRDGDSAAEPEVYVMTAMTFGSACSPTSAQFVKNKNALEFAVEFPEAAEAVQHKHYVDDYVDSFSSSEKAQQITAEVIEVHRRGGFELRGVVSNCPAVRARFGSGDGRNSSICLEPEDQIQKILGMTWETDDDTFVFQTRFHRVPKAVMEGSRKPTKRELLSVIMSIFDPFGLLSVFMLPAKIMMQEMWRQDFDWDDPLPPKVDEQWQAWRIEVEQTRRVRVPRCYSPAILTAPVQLHLFADASEEAFACAAYWRVEAPEGVDLAFVAGKVRCAPMQLLSIPRLELQAAVLATRLMIEIRNSHPEVDIAKTVLWSDSQTVLRWLRCDQRRYVTFVGNRVAEVVESAPAAWWRYVPTAMNVADDATRVRTPIQFDPQSRWIYGPAWLKDAESEWPEQPAFIDSEAPEVELRKKFVGATIERGAAVEFERFSKWMRLARCFAWTQRFGSNLRTSPEHRIRSELTALEVDRGILGVCRLVQAEIYPADVGKLRSGQPLTPDSDLFALNPYLDEDGVLRLYGRTDEAKEEFMSGAAKRPIIMPAGHYVTMLIVRHYHEHMAHQLTDATIAAVRSKFWVLKIRPMVKTVQAACQLCRIRAAKPKPPMQGQLPGDRLTAFVRPFTSTGLDFFGPYLVTVGRRTEKRWVALFTCMASRAVHLEVAADLSSDACLICLRNFCNLRGVPAVIRCDNGTNFVGAKNELLREQKFFDPVALQKELSVKGIEWRFNCPNNPEAGGAWERLVQSVKRVLGVTLNERAPRVETFRALLLEAANIVNARPLTHVPVGPDDPEPLTPNHFLIGGPNVATVPNPEDLEPTATRRQWQICRGLSRMFWAQFVRDYLPELTRRSRHYPDQQPLQEGDLVFICDDHRASWTRGRVTAVIRAKDGAVRRATVRTAAGDYQRPATRLARIDVSSSGSNDVRGAVSPTAAGRE